MATRIPYTASDDDIYSQLMAQFAQAQPYYSAAPVDYASGLLGGYDTSMYAPTAAATAAPAAATVSRPYYGGVDYGFGPVTAGSPGDGSVPFDTMTPAEQAEFYAANPTFAAITQGLQGLFGMTSLGMLQNAMVPDFVQAQSEIAHGIVPGSVNSISAQNAMDVGAHPGLGFGSGIQQANAGNQSLTGGLLDFSGQQAPAPVTDLSTLSNELAAQQMAAEINASLANAATQQAAPTGVEVGGPISSGNAVGVDISTPSLGNDTVGFGSYGETGGMVDAGGGGDGGGGATVICTKLHSLGKMPEDIFEADQAFGEMMIRLHPEIYAGYILWAKHVVRWMGRDDFIGKAVVAVVETLAKPWSIAMAEEMGVNVKSSWFGRLLLKRGMQICKFIGGMTKKEGLQNV
jgi:hypothetical protein